MAGADNPLADFYNANALQAMIGPNPYSKFNGSPLQIPGYAGTPTNAMGAPIQAQPGTTLNSTPSAPAPAAQQTPNGAFSPEQAARILQGTGQWGLSPQGPDGRGGVNNQAALDAQTRMSAGYNPMAPQPGAAQPGAAGAAAPPASSMDSALSLLSNPGKVTTPGANAPTGQMPNVLDAFLANNPGPQAPGAGGYSNAPFFNTLRGLRQGAPA